MNMQGWSLLAAFSVVLLVLALPLGRYIASVMEGRMALAGKIEARLYRMCGVKADAEMGWLQYAWPCCYSIRWDCSLFTLCNGFRSGYP